LKGGEKAAWMNNLGTRMGSYAFMNVVGGMAERAWFDSDPSRKAFSGEMVFDAALGLGAGYALPSIPTWGRKIAGIPVAGPKGGTLNYKPGRLARMNPFSSAKYSSILEGATSASGKVAWGQVASKTAWAATKRVAAGIAIGGGAGYALSFADRNATSEDRKQYAKYGALAGFGLSTAAALKPAVGKLHLNPFSSSKYANILDDAVKESLKVAKETGKVAKVAWGTVAAESVAAFVPRAVAALVTASTAPSINPFVAEIAGVFCLIS